MTDSTTNAHTANARPVEAAHPGAALFGLFRGEALKAADETERAIERTLVEGKRAAIDGSRLWESQLELAAAMNRSMFDTVRRTFNF